jgi:hypothetical protein
MNLWIIYKKQIHGIVQYKSSRNKLSFSYNKIKFMRKIFEAIITIGLIFLISSCASRAHCDAYSAYEKDSTEVVG